MSDSIAEILGSHRFEEPPEAAAIKKYVETKYHKHVSVLVREREISIIVPSGALATTLRMKVPEIQRVAETKKRLLFRIG